MLKTKRLYIRNFRHDDADVLYNYRNDERCNLYQRYENTGKEYLKKLGFIEECYADSIQSYVLIIYGNFHNAR